MPNGLYKDPCNGWKARTRFSLGQVTQDGKTGERVLDISTNKRSHGRLITSATVAFCDGLSEIHRFGFGSGGDYRKDLVVTAAKCTEKAVREQHAKAIEQAATLIEEVQAFYAGK